MNNAITKREPMPLSSVNVNHIFHRCTAYAFIEDTDPEIIAVDGVMLKARFVREHIESYRADIINMLEQLPDTFHVGMGDGWTFLNMCIDRNGEQWTDYHKVCDMLLCLGIAIGACQYTIKQRDLWRVFPGEMPYITINTNAAV
ncbi:MAG: hypothetical protein NC401_10425 [Ruminococcus sp.]|nr:hypothetical protein [Ruminococcus sp.]MCM1438987.1 hypothetical protein [Roseburia sp.]